MQTGDTVVRERGSIYVLLLLMIAVIGGATSLAVSVGARMARRDAEQHLLVIGAAFQQALASHAGTPLDHPRASGVGPRELQDLLRDSRVPGLRRHLRNIPVDPLTGRSQWGLVRDAQGGIVGVHSLAVGVPIKRTGFESRWSAFEQAQSYRSWVFGAKPLAAAPILRPVAGPPTLP